jgi:predicted nucleic acid-binding protein
MSAERVTYIDSSALVKLAVREPESAALRRYLRRRRPLVSSALARTEVARALLPLGREAVQRGHDVLSRVDLVRINDRVLNAAGAMSPATLGSLDAIHLATAEQFGSELAGIVTYDERMATAAEELGLRVARPRSTT